MTRAITDDPSRSKPVLEIADLVSKKLKARERTVTNLGEASHDSRARVAGGQDMAEGYDAPRRRGRSDDNMPAGER